MAEHIRAETEKWVYVAPECLDERLVGVLRILLEHFGLTSTKVRKQEGT